MRGGRKAAANFRVFGGFHHIRADPAAQFKTQGGRAKEPNEAFEFKSGKAKLVLPLLKRFQAK